MLTQPTRPILGGTLLKPERAGVPVAIVQRASSIWTATLTTQLKMTIQRMTKPTWAPSVVVAISSPEPTIDALKIRPGPRYFRLSSQPFGGSLISSPVT